MALPDTEDYFTFRLKIECSELLVFSTDFWQASTKYIMRHLLSVPACRLLELSGNTYLDHGQTSQESFLQVGKTGHVLSESSTSGLV